MFILWRRQRFFYPFVNNAELSWVVHVKTLMCTITRSTALDAAATVTAPWCSTAKDSIDRSFWTIEHNFTLNSDEEKDKLEAKLKMFYQTQIARRPPKWPKIPFFCPCWPWPLTLTFKLVLERDQTCLENLFSGPEYFTHKQKHRLTAPKTELSAVHCMH